LQQLLDASGRENFSERLDEAADERCEGSDGRMRAAVVPKAAD